MGTSRYVVSLPLSGESPADSLLAGHADLLIHQTQDWSLHNCGIQTLRRQRIQPNAPTTQSCDHKKI